MAKTSAILEDVVDRIPIAEFSSGAREFEGTIPSPRSAFSARHEHTMQVELDKLSDRVDLVSRRSSSRRRKSTAS
jgi:hypothetical protein